MKGLLSRIAAFAALAAAYGLVCHLMLTFRVAAHEAPAGWSYPVSCCSGLDCRPVPPAFVEERAGGVTLMPSGERIAEGDPRLKDSPDGEFHWCTVAGSDTGRTLCLFRPHRGF